MGPENGHIPGLRVRVIDGDILLYRQQESGFLLICCGTGVFPDMLAWSNMLNNPKRARLHIDISFSLQPSMWEALYISDQREGGGIDGLMRCNGRCCWMFQ